MLTVRLETLGLTAGDWVLDLGCGEGRHVHGIHMLPGVNVVGLDLDIPSLVKARDGLGYLPPTTGEAATSFLSGDAYRLPFADAAFDVVICSEVLEHLHEYDRALAEIRRVLKPGGRFVPTVPAPGPSASAGRWRLARTAMPTSPAATSASSTNPTCASPSATSAFPTTASTTPTPCTPLLVAEVRLLGPARRPPAGEALPPLPGLGPDGPARPHPRAGGHGQPFAGKSVALYFRKGLA
uniref:Class I SAM-dependent methyltransferase n=1 Tax=Phenylobacterium glaciei TaxID=2803784 RepID=A0A974P1K4_9CAUL|nr:class I SAM-dependent methyltransferase [Phenylobacterium glaciei]